MSIPSRIGPRQTMPETTLKSATILSVSVLRKDFAVSPKTIPFTLASSLHRRLEPTNKEPSHETRHSICQYSRGFHLCERCGAGISAHSAVSLPRHCADSREVEVHDSH